MMMIKNRNKNGKILIRTIFWGDTIPTIVPKSHDQKVFKIAFKIILILNSWTNKLSRRKNRKNVGIRIGMCRDLRSVVTQLLYVWIFPPLPFFVSWCIIRLPCTNFEVCMKLNKNWKTGSFRSESPHNPSKWKLFTLKTWIKQGTLRNIIYFCVTPSDKVKKTKCVKWFCELF